MDISAIVCTHNRAHLLSLTLASLLDQTLTPDRYEVLVVDNASTDDPEPVVRAIAGHAPNVRFLREPLLGLSNARNRGLAEALGRIVAFVDDDARADRGWLQSLRDTFDSELPRPLCAGGKVLPLWTRPRPAWLPDKFISMLSLVDYGEQLKVCDFPREHLVGCNLALEREFALASGGFEPSLGRKGSNLIGNEDAEVLGRVKALGGSILYQPAAVVHHTIHSQRLHLLWFVRRMFGQGASDVITEGIWAARPSIPGQYLPSLSSLSSVKDRLGLLQNQRPAQAAFFILMGIAYSAGRASQRRRSVTTARSRPAAVSR